MKVFIATKNPCKIEGATRAFKHFFDNVEVTGIPASSDVADEPVNEDIYNGAKNRVGNLKKYVIENNLDADYYISVESGITNRLGKWMIVNIAVIEDKNGFKSVGSSAGFPVAEKYVDEIISTDLGKVMDKIFNENELRLSKGGISLLTKDVISRYDLTEQAFIMALTQHINGDVWK